MVLLSSKYYDIVTSLNSGLCQITRIKDVTVQSRASQVRTVYMFALLIFKIRQKGGYSKFSDTVYFHLEFFCLFIIIANDTFLFSSFTIAWMLQVDMIQGILVDSSKSQHLGKSTLI